MSDTYTAVWVSYSSIKDFLTCPRAYYLNNVYKDPKTNRKISIMSPPLALGQAVHEVIEALSVLPTDKRFHTPLSQAFSMAWKKVAGKKGGFTDNDEEERYKERGHRMLGRVLDHPGPLKQLAVKIKGELPYYWLSREDEIILCGKIDWLEYLPETDAVHIIDFKTGTRKEPDDSLQLPIYYLLTTNCQQRPVEKASYWYLDSADTPVEKPLPDPESSHQTILNHAKQIKLARKLERFKCEFGGCSACTPLERVIAGEGEYVGLSEFNNKDIYILPKLKEAKKESVIL